MKRATRPALDRLQESTRRDCEGNRESYLRNPATQPRGIYHHAPQATSLAALLVLTVSIVLMGTVPVSAHRSPSNCRHGGLQMSLFAFRLDGSAANTITNGEKIVYLIQVQNDSQLPGPNGNEPVCDISCATILLQCPDVNGRPGPVSLVVSNVNL